MSDWIEWNGGLCPLPPHVMVFLRLRDGYEQTNYGKAGSYYWKHDGDNCDIIAYRLAEPVAVKTISEPVATINIDDALDELSHIMAIWHTNRQNGRTPRHIKTAILSMIKEISQQ